MSTVSLNVILVCILPRNSVVLTLICHCSVECSIEYYGSRCVRQNLLASSDTYQCRWVVERSECAEFFDTCLNLIRDDFGLIKKITALYDPVSYSSDFIHRFDNSVLTISQSINYQLHCDTVIRQRDIFVKYSPFSGLVIHMSVNADSLAETLGQYALIFHVDELILKRRTSRVNYQNNHILVFLSYIYTSCKLAIKNRLHSN